MGHLRQVYLTAAGHVTIMRWLIRYGVNETYCNATDRSLLYYHFNVDGVKRSEWQSPRTDGRRHSCSASRVRIASIEAKPIDAIRSSCRRRAEWMMSLTYNLSPENSPTRLINLSMTTVMAAMTIAINERFCVSFFVFVFLFL